MNTSFTIFQIVCAFMLLVFLLGGSMATWYFIRLVGKKEANYLFSFFLGALSLSLLHNLLVNIGIFNNQPKYYFIPIWYTLSFGPLLFFFVKSRLFRAFYLERKDFKHFILPLLQATFYLFVGFRGASFKAHLWDGQYIPLYKPIEGLCYIIGFSFYLYFSYRFIRYKLLLLRRKRAFSWEIDKVRRLKRLTKGLILLFSISALYMIGDFCTYRFLGLNLYNIRGFTYIGDLSFTFIVLWVSYYAFRNAFFPSRQRLRISKEPQHLLDKIDTLFKEDKIFMDDELDARKLSYFLKIRTKELSKLLPDNFKKILNTYRLEEAKKRLLDPNYKKITWERIGLDLGFPTAMNFAKHFKISEKVSPERFRANKDAS